MEHTLIGGCWTVPFATNNFCSYIAMPLTVRQRHRRICRGLFIGGSWLAVALLLVWLMLGPNRLIYDLLAWVWAAPGR